MRELNPQARRDALIVEELADELLIHDLVRHKAHCLNRSAALIWRHCDGAHSPAALASLLQRELGRPVERAIVVHAIDQLSRAHLLDSRAPDSGPRLSRRDAAKALGAAALLPAVFSILAPTAAYAASNNCRIVAGGNCVGTCTTAGQSCQDNNGNCRCAQN